MDAGSLARELARKGIDDDRVLAAMATVPRERFVPAWLAGRAFEDEALPIGQGQTISQPFVVAVMTSALQLQGGERVLEIGTGSGYQTAVLAAMGAEVWSMEVLPELQHRAAMLLAELAIPAHLRVGDGSAGWPQAAPFDAVLSAAASTTVPGAWLQQVRPSGRIVLPVGTPDSQELVVVRPGNDGNPTMLRLLPVRFVPLVGEGGQPL